MKRPKGYMSEGVLAAAMEHLIATGDRLIVLHHFGEPLIHPQLEDRLEQIRRAGLSAQLSTNGLLLEKMWPTLVDSSLDITVMLSVHQWVMDGHAAYAVALAKWAERAAGTKITIIPAYNAKQDRFSFHRWTAGDTKSWEPRSCCFIRQNLAVVLWNGDLVTCCCDHEGITRNGNILFRQARQSKVWADCPTCEVGPIMANETW
jgi:hypothetical protein